MNMDFALFFDMWLYTVLPVFLIFYPMYLAARYL